MRRASLCCRLPPKSGVKRELSTVANRPMRGTMVGQPEVKISTLRRITNSLPVSLLRQSIGTRKKMAARGTRAPSPKRDGLP
jgi:hypothetical protein